MAEITDYYQTLEVSETASAAEIKRAYRHLARAFHPDRNGGDPAGSRRFRSIQEAYEVLAHPEKRAAYDRIRRDPFAEIGREVRSGYPHRDAEAEARLSFEQSIHGGTVDAVLPDGTSTAIPVPRGIRSGVRMRFKGRIPARDSQEPGDLYVTFRITPSPRFRREGNDLHIVEPVSVVEALLGASRVITDPYGRAIKVAIPPGTQPGEHLRLRGQGVQAGATAGDLYVEIRVTVPRALTDEQRAALSACVREVGLI